MFLDNRSKPNFEALGAKVKGIVVNAVFRLSIALSVAQIFAIEVYRIVRNLVHLLITHEPLHLA